MSSNLIRKLVDQSTNIPKKVEPSPEVKQVLKTLTSKKWHVMTGTKTFRADVLRKRILAGEKIEDVL